MGSSLAVTGATTLTGGVTGAVLATGAVTGSSINNSSFPSSAIAQIVNAGVAGTGTTLGPTGVGNNILTLDVTTIFPGSENLKAYRLYISGSVSNRFSIIGCNYSGAGSAGQLFLQWQSVSGFTAGNSLKGTALLGTTALGAGGGGPLGVTPDNQIIFAGDLTNNTVYWCGSADNGGTVGFNTTATNIWLSLVPVV
jgi:hypothetical protein